MPNDLVEAENELSSVLQEKRHVQEHIDAIQHHISKDETWLSLNDPGTVDYQKTLEELIVLQAFVAELHAQVASLEEVSRELLLEREHWLNPELLLSS
jgi:hypothetical protein